MNLTLALYALALPTTASAQDAVAESDWLAIRAAHDADRHAAHEIEGKFTAQNPRQGWRMSFDTRGFLIEPKQSDWRWGLELVSYGFKDSQQFVGEAACANAEGGRVSYTWDDGIEEWYVNDARGFEHGFTVHERPSFNADAPGPLTLELHVRGDLTPQVHVSRRGIAFVDSNGNAVLNYSGLTVFDANGETLEAWFECREGTVTFRVNENGAQYPLTIDPVAQEAYLKASNTDAVDRFGDSIAAYGDTVVVGAKFEDSNATGVDGDGSDNSALASGAAYVFRRVGNSWFQEAYLKASNSESDDFFGCSVSISGDTIVIGAYQEDSAATGVNGDQTDNSLSDSGAAYVFQRIGTSWSQQAYLKALTSDATDGFGLSTGISDDTITVGAAGEDGTATGSNGDATINGASRAGAAYVFVRSGTNWSQQAYLKPSNPEQHDNFGDAIGISEDTIVVGAFNEDGGSAGVNGDENDNSLVAAGAAYVFRRSGTTWNQEAYLKASNPNDSDRFASAVGVSGDTVVVGAPLEDSGATGINGDENDNSLNAPGAAYVFRRAGTLWSQEAYLKASNTNSPDQFGTSVAISSDTIVVGAKHEASDASGVNGNQSSNLAVKAGAAYLFARHGTTWNQETYIKASNPGGSVSSLTGDSFGWSVAISDEFIAVGAPREESSSTGINGDENDNSALLAGAAYVFQFDIPIPIGTSLCTGDGGNQLGCTNCPCGNNASLGTIGGCLNTAGTSASLIASGDASVSLPPNDTTDLRFALTSAHANILAFLNSGDAVAPGGMANPCFGLDSGVQSAALDGLRCAIVNTRRHDGRIADAQGNIGLTNEPWGGEGGPAAGIAVKGVGFASGQTRYFQAIYRTDPLLGCMRGLNTSQAIEITFVP